ncbi:MAG: hypothetical protein ACSLFP_02185 [Acidimicrobiales bacterium]
MDDLAVREQVEVLMARLRDGEGSAVWDLHAVAEPALRRMVRAEARRIDVRIGDDDVLDLTLDAAIELGNLAQAWQPDGALPWVWARRRIAALVHQHVGVFTDPLPEAAEAAAWEEPAAPPPVDDPQEVLRRLARHHPAARRLQEHLQVTASERDAAIWLEVRMEQAAGNRSPAVTVGVGHDLEPATVRKVVQRVTQRLDAVA